MNELLDAALLYATWGWRVFPLHNPTGDEQRPCSCGNPKCESIGKHPRIIGWQQNATTDEAQLRQWWQMWPASNVGIAMGEGSGIWALDIDGSEGTRTLADRESKNGMLPITAESITGSGGRHKLFAFSPGLQNRVRFAPGLDLRTEGGLIVAPPSLHANGCYYMWDPAADPSEVGMAEAPEWLLAEIRAASRPKVAAGKPGEAIREGGRNDRLFRDGCSMRRRGFGEGAILAALREMNRDQCQPPLDEEEVLIIAGKAAKYAPEPEKATTNGVHPPETFEPDPAMVRKPRGFTAAELAVTELDDPRWAVLDYISEGLTILAGGQKLGKSWLAFDLSLAVAMGGYAFGIIPVAEGDVLYLALEDTPRRLKDRLLKLLQGEPAPKRLQIFTEWARIDQGGLVWIESWLEKCEAPRLVIIDTLKKIRPTRPKGGNAYDEDYDFMGQIKRLADKHSIAILVLHHTRKMKADDPFDAVSGTMGLTAAADATMVLERIRGKQEAILNLTGRDIEEREVAMGWDKETGMWTIIGSAEEHRRSTERQAIVEVLRESKVPLSPKDVAEALGKNRNTVRVLMMKLAANGEIQLLTPGKYGVV